MSLIGTCATEFMQIAIDSIAMGLVNDYPLVINLSEQPKLLQEKGASFVSIYGNGKMIGCMGTVFPQKPLAEDIAISAFNAAYKDPRFQGLSVRDITEKKITVEVAILSPLEFIECSNEQELSQSIEENKDGLFILENNKSALLLPNVWGYISDKHKFIAELKKTIGLDEKYWSNTVKFYRFTSENFVSEWPDMEEENEEDE